MMAIYPDLKGKNVILTGGANGIGAATVRAFAEQEARVFFCDVDSKAGRALAREHANVAFAKVDLAREREIVQWVNRVTAVCGEIHVLVNNAAVDPRVALEKTSAEQWDRILNTNLRACFFMAREVGVRMPDGGGSIINLASITFHNGPPTMSAYVASKGGVIGFTRSLARELGPRGIRVNVVSPGWIMTRRQLKQYVTPAVKRMIRERQCLPALLQPGEIARVILFLASEASAAMTGQELLADRGWAFS